MKLLDFLAQFLEYFLAWIPRPVYVPRCDAVIRWTFNWEPRRVRGVAILVPLFQHMERVDLRATPIEFEPKFLWTKDGHTVAVGMAMLWRIEDPLLTCQTVNELPDLVPRIAETVLPALVGQMTLSEFKLRVAGAEENRWSFAARLQAALRSKLKRFGLTVEEVELNFTSDRVRTLKLIGSNPLAL